MSCYANASPMSSRYQRLSSLARVQSSSLCNPVSGSRQAAHQSGHSLVPTAPRIQYATLGKKRHGIGGAFCLDWLCSSHKELGSGHLLGVSGEGAENYGNMSRRHQVHPREARMGTSTPGTGGHGDRKVVRGSRRLERRVWGADW